MTLTELKYIVAVAREKHFGAAAEACFVSQPTLSVAVKKLEDELGLRLFERGRGEVTITPLGEEIVYQAQVVLEQADEIKRIAKKGKDPLSGPLALGVIYTIAPYILPELVMQVVERTPQMPLILQENFTTRLLEMLHNGEIDCALLAEPFPRSGLLTEPLYIEPFFAAVPAAHPLARLDKVHVQELQNENVLLLGAGHCFRDHVLQVCPEFAQFASDASGIRKSFEGSSLETIKQMVAAGMGVTLVPRLAIPAGALSGKNLAGLPLRGRVRYVPVVGDASAPAPERRVVLAWRRSFARHDAIRNLCENLAHCQLPGTTWLSQMATHDPQATQLQVELMQNPML